VIAVFHIYDWLKEFSGDILALVASSSLVGAYYLNFHNHSQRDPSSSIHAVNAAARRPIPTRMSWPCRPCATSSWSEY
jgi:hypothetical protein